MKFASCSIRGSKRRSERSESRAMKPLHLPALLLLLALTTAAAVDDWTRLDQQSAERYRSGDYAAALDSAQQALTLAERSAAAFGPGKARVATSLNVLALIHQAQGQLDEAIAEFERAVTIGESALPADHPNLVALRGNLESARQAQRQNELDSQAQRTQQLNEQALAHHERGEYEQAAALYEQVLPLVEQHFGTDSREAGRVLAGLADTQFMRKQYEQAAASYQRAIRIFETQEGEAVALAGALDALARVHYAQRQYSKAEPLFQRALATLEAELGPEHVDLLPVLDNLAALKLTTHREEQAREFQLRARSIRKANGVEAETVKSRASQG